MVINTALITTGSIKIEILMKRRPPNYTQLLCKLLSACLLRFQLNLTTLRLILRQFHVLNILFSGAEADIGMDVGGKLCSPMC